MPCRGRVLPSVSCRSSVILVICGQMGQNHFAIYWLSSGDFNRTFKPHDNQYSHFPAVSNLVDDPLILFSVTCISTWACMWHSVRCVRQLWIFTVAGYRQLHSAQLRSAHLIKPADCWCMKADHSILLKHCLKGVVAYQCAMLIRSECWAHREIVFPDYKVSDEVCYSTHIGFKDRYALILVAGCWL